MTTILAIDVGGTTIKAELQSADHQPLLAARRPAPRGPEGNDGSPVLDVVGALARELIGSVAPGSVDAVGLGVPGIVDLNRGMGVLSTNLGWRDAPLVERLQADLQLPVVLSHDVSAAGLAEFRLGAGRGARDVLFVVIGTGIAAAVLAGGSLVTGGAGQAGEIGHLRVRSSGPRCGCGGRGCLESFASARSIATAYAIRTGRAVDGALAVMAALPTDPDAAAVWLDAVTALADGLLATQAVLASERVILGGGLASAGPALLEPLAAAMRDRATVQTVPELRVAELGERAGIVGAGMAALEALRATRVGGTPPPR